MDPFCLFAVVPMVFVAGLVIWGGIVLIGVVVLVLTALLVLIDSWANRPMARPQPGYRDDY